MNMFRALLFQKALIAVRCGAIFNIVFFFLFTLFITKMISNDSGIIKLVLISMVFSVGRSSIDIFDDDIADGSIDMMIVSSSSILSLLSSLVVTNWFFSGFVVCIVSVAINYLSDFSYSVGSILLIFVFNFSLYCAGALGASLTFKMLAGKVLSVVTIMPVYTILLILVLSAIENSSIMTMIFALLFIFLLSFSMIFLASIAVKSSFSGMLSSRVDEKGLIE